MIAWAQIPGAARLGREVLSWASRHIRLIREPATYPYLASLSLTPAGYTVHLREDVWDHPEEEQAVILTHELQHLLRGDLLRLQDRDPHTWNLACDAIINDGLPRETIETLDGWTLSRLRGAYPAAPIPEHPPGADSVYAALVGQQPPPTAMDGMAVEGDAGSVRQAHVRAVMTSPSAGDVLGQALGPPRCIHPRRSRVAGLDAILARIVRQTAAPWRRYRYTWMREGHLPTVPGWSTGPSPQVAIAVDVSGSMTEAVPVALGVAAAVADRAAVSVYVWAEQCVRTRLDGRVPAVGSGTCPAVIWPALTGRPQCVVVVTDGEFTGGAPPRTAPPVVLVSPQNPWRLRPQDRWVQWRPLT